MGTVFLIMSEHLEMLGLGSDRQTRALSGQSGQHHLLFVKLSQFSGERVDPTNHAVCSALSLVLACPGSSDYVRIKEEDATG